MDALPPSATYKPGFKTSEFWLVVVNTMLGLPIMMGYITPEEADNLSKAVEAVIGGLMVLIPTIIYIFSRIAAKKNLAKSSTGTLDLPSAEVSAAAAVAPLQYAK